MKPLFGIIPPIATPTDQNGIFIKEAMKDNIRKWEETRLHGYVVLGSNGEACLFDEDDQVEIVETVRVTMRKERRLFVGINVQSARTAIRLIRRFSEFSPDAALILPPYYYKTAMTPKAIESYYREIADESSIPILIYNMPSYTGIDIPVSTIVSLSEHPNIVGMKESSPNIVKIGEILRDVSPEFFVFAGSGSYLFTAVILGACGAIPALGNVAPEECVELYKSATKGAIMEGTKLQIRLLALNKAVTTKYGIAGLKYAMELRGLKGGIPCKPLLPLSENEKREIEEIIIQAQLTPLS